jgi:hypothetical protein
LVALAWGAAIAGLQLRLTWELTGVAGFVRPPEFLANYVLPPAHWAQLALPAVFLGRPFGAGESYWAGHATTAGEACAYVGIVPIILALVGFVASPHDRALAPWRVIVPVSLGLATMAGWWPDAFYVLLKLPGLGWFRAPARYTLLTSLGLALLAGRGLDRAIVPRRFGAGLALALVFGATAWGWSIYWARGAEFQLGVGSDTLPTRFAAAGLAWGLGLAAIVAWRLGTLGAFAPLLLTGLELGPLLFLGPVWWSWTVRLSEASTVVRRLAAEPEVGLVASQMMNLPSYAGRTTAFPTLGIIPPPPNYLLEPATYPPGRLAEFQGRWLRRFGVTHGIWASDDDVRGTSILAIIEDPALDRVLQTVPIVRGRGPWKLVHYPLAFPAARIARRVSVVPRWGRLYANLSIVESPDHAWLIEEDRPAQLPDLGDGTATGAASVRSWDGKTAIVDHEGPCILILRRTHYPGWFYRVNGGPEQPVLKVDGGIQGVPIAGSGTTRVETHYRPTGLARAAMVTLGALAAAMLVLGAAGWRALRAP